MSNIFQSVKRYFHLSLNVLRDKRTRLVSATRKKDEGTDGERFIEVDSLSEQKFSIFPTKNLPNRLFFGIPFKEIPICHIKSTKNNTIMQLTDYRGVPKLIKSCGIEGFKNVRKGTNIAAQTTAINFSANAIELGIKNVRVCIQGLGPGRMASIKGLQMGGLNVISITDTTRISWNPPRPRKRRRV